MTTKQRRQDMQYRFPPLICFFFWEDDIYDLLILFFLMNHQMIEGVYICTLTFLSFYLGIDQKRSLNMNECSELTLFFRILGGIN